MQNPIDLSGNWEFKLDPEHVGELRGYVQGGFDAVAQLPGSLDTNGIGDPNFEVGYLGGLSRKVTYTGPAWFSREVVIPESLRGKPLHLLLERVHWFSTVWVDGVLIGEGESLSVPHRFVVPASDAATIRLTIRVDNTPRIAIGRICHALTDWTQTNWNGVIGRMTLSDACPPETAPTPVRIEIRDRDFWIDGKPVFLRGTLECCVFPLTGHPPMERGPWDRIMARAKEYGLNHLRFHSYCPPEAAFAAADEAGVILQVEAPLWTGRWPVSSDPDLLEFVRRESRRILSEYGHHPSFCLFTLGNEIAFYGSEPEIDRLLAELRADFPRQRINFSAHGTHLSPECDYYVQADNGKPGPGNRPLRGSTWFGVGSRFDREAPNTTSNVNEAAQQFDRPVISHEVAEWAVYPEVTNVAKYTGVLEPRNLTAIAESAAQNGLAGQERDFVRASGSLSALLYKEEIECLLRTDKVAGYQLLGLTDFPGQGTATIGMLDAFWDSKGFVEGETFRQFCADTVPLALLPKFVWTRGETFRAGVQVHHYGDPVETSVRWSLGNADGEFESKPLNPAGLTEFGEVSVDLAEGDEPQRLTLEVRAGESVNQWPVWVLPESAPTAVPEGVRVFERYAWEVLESLRKGETVWLKLENPWPSASIPGRFAPAFWSPIHFKEQVGTMGTLIQKDHPIFAQFPTADHTDWLWWDVLTRSVALVLDGFPAEFRPIVQVIDRYERNWKLGTILEAQVGPGKLLVTAIDFTTALAERPATRQLLRSIHGYLAEGATAQAPRLTSQHLDRLFRHDP